MSRNIAAVSLSAALGLFTLTNPAYATGGSTAVTELILDGVGEGAQIPDELTIVKEQPKDAADAPASSSEGAPGASKGEEGDSAGNPEDPAPDLPSDSGQNAGVQHDEGDADDVSPAAEQPKAEGEDAMSTMAAAELEPQATGIDTADKLAAAIAEDGEAVLSSNITLSGPLEITGHVTIDLAGNILTGARSSTSMFRIAENAKVTVTDSLMSGSLSANNPTAVAEALGDGAEFVFSGDYLTCKTLFTESLNSWVATLNSGTVALSNEIKAFSCLLTIGADCTVESRGATCFITGDLNNIDLAGKLVYRSSGTAFTIDTAPIITLESTAVVQSSGNVFDIGEQYKLFIHDGASISAVGKVVQFASSTPGETSISGGSFSDDTIFKLIDQDTHALFFDGEMYNVRPISYVTPANVFARVGSIYCENLDAFNKLRALHPSAEVTWQNACTVTINWGVGSNTGTSGALSLQRGDRIPQASIPTDYANIEGYRFTGWTDSQGNAIENLVDFQVVENTVITANYVMICNVTLSWGVAPSQQSKAISNIEENAFIQASDIPTANNVAVSGKRFLGWFDESGTRVGGYSASGAIEGLDKIPIRGTMAFHAEYATEYSVQFISSIDDKVVKRAGGYIAGEHIEASVLQEVLSGIDAAARDYRFTGWRVGSAKYASNAALASSYAISGDATVYVDFVQLFEVLLEDEDGGVIQSGKAASGEKLGDVLGLNLPTDAQMAKRGFKFIGWYDPESDKYLKYAELKDLVIPGEARYTAKYEQADDPDYMDSPPEEVPPAIEVPPATDVPPVADPVANGVALGAAAPSGGNDSESPSDPVSTKEPVREEEEAEEQDLAETGAAAPLADAAFDSRDVVASVVYDSPTTGDTELPGMFDDFDMGTAAVPLSVGGLAFAALIGLKITQFAAANTAAAASVSSGAPPF